jgi:hypothetical protein
MAIRARLKSVLRRLLAPILRRMTAGLDARMTTIETAWNHYIPTFLSAVSSVGALGREQLDVRRDLEREIASLRGEIEALSRRIDASAAVGDQPTKSKPVIVATERVEKARLAGLKLDLEGGGNAREGFINVDRRPLPGIDVIAAPGDLPFEPASVTEIDAAGLLDRVTEGELRRGLLPFWLSLLVPGGRFRAVVRDAEATITALAAGKCSFDEFRAALLDQDRDGSYRGNLFTPDSVSRLLAETGFVNIDTMPVARPDDRAPAFAISAERPKA